MEQPQLQQQLEKMRNDWDERARDNARFYVATGNFDWTDEEFFASGETTVADHILSDLGNICQGRNPKKMRVLEIGCGTGRITRALARRFGEVHAVDVSGEMIQQANLALRRSPNAFVYQNNGKDLSVLGDLRFDFAFSTIVFQHIPSHEIVESYVHEVHRVLRDGRLFKFQVQGFCSMKRKPDDTWLGVSYSDTDVLQLAAKTGFEARYRHGAGTQDFWIWFFRRPWHRRLWRKHGATA